MKNDLLCFGHRGAAGHAPENTLLSIRKALELQTPWIEIDVYSVEGRILVFHDERVDRLSNAEGYIQEKSFDDLRKLDVGQSQQIPTLEEICQEVSGRAGLNIELKGPGTAKKVVEVVAEALNSGWTKEQFLISSFRHHELLEVRTLDPELRIGVLIGCIPIERARCAEELGAFSLHPTIEFIDRELVEDAHARGLKVFGYTANHPEDIARMYHLGVDGVFTDYPERVLEFYSQPSRIDLPI